MDEAAAYLRVTGGDAPVAGCPRIPSEENFLCAGKLSLSEVHERLCRAFLGCLRPQGLLVLKAYSADRRVRTSAPMSRYYCGSDNMQYATHAA